MHLVGALRGDVRLETFRGAEHVVAPVVMLVGDSVIHPVNAEEPEFVPASVLAVAPAGWNGRPCMAGDHPNDGDEMLSANTPSVLESMGFGQLFSVEFSDNLLRGEAWLDVARARAIGEVAERLVERVRENEPVEISVGAYVVHEQRPGTHNGRRYGAVWAEQTPDHIAILREGLIGACSNAMGCGIPRAAVRHLVTESGLSIIEAAAGSCETCGGSGVATGTDDDCGSCYGTGMRGATRHDVVYRDGNWCVLSSDGSRVISRHQTKASAREWKRRRRWLRAAEEGDVAESSKPTLVDKLLGVFSIRSAKAPADMGDDERRSLVGEALKRVDTQCVGVVSMTGLEDGEVVYWIDPDPGGPTPLRAYKRTYQINAEGRVSIGEERVPVRASTEWVPIVLKGKKQNEEVTAAGGCGCGGGGDKGAETGAEGGAMAAHRNAERIQALIANDKTPFTDADKTFLEGLTDERLTAFETVAKPVEQPAAAPQTEQPAAAATTAATTAPAAPAAATAQTEQPTAAKSTVEIEASELATLRQMASKHQAQEQAQKVALVERLKGAQSVYNEARLKTMSLDQLKEVAQLVDAQVPGEVDYSLVASGSRGNESTAPPKPYDLAVARRNKGTSAA